MPLSDEFWEDEPEPESPAPVPDPPGLGWPLGNFTSLQGFQSPGSKSIMFALAYGSGQVVLNPNGQVQSILPSAPLPPGAVLLATYPAVDAKLTMEYTIEVPPGDYSKPHRPRRGFRIPKGERFDDPLGFKPRPSKKRRLKEHCP